MNIELQDLQNALNLYNEYLLSDDYNDSNINFKIWLTDRIKFQVLSKNYEETETVI